MLILLGGLAAGTVHVFAGPDHLAAVAPLAAENPRKATMTGFKWGLGHGLGAVFMGLLALLVRDAVDMEQVASWMEFLVGFMLIGLGIWAFLKARQLSVHAHEHQHDSKGVHQHIHVHVDDEKHEGGHEHSHAPLYVGALHGSAGTGHLFAVIPALSFDSTTDTAIYLGAYFVAAVLSMTLFGFLLRLIINPEKPLRIRNISYVAATLAIVIGCYWIVSTWPGSA